jgi:hypothetical protein
MGKRLRAKLTYSNVIASIALFVALSGVAVAATNLPRNSVGPNQLKRGAVTTPKLRKAAVKAGKLAPKAVVAGKIGTGAVLSGNIANGGVNTNKIANGAVRAINIKNNVVTTNKLNNNAVTTQKLAPNAVETNNLANGSVTLAKLAEDVSPLLGTLKSGQTLRGVFSLGDNKGEAADLARAAVSYQFPLLAKPAVTVLRKGQTSANCAGLSGGNAETPQATAGNLCVYLTEEANLDDSEPLSVELNTRLGFGLVAKAKEAAAFSGYGQWAVTAP